MRLGLSISSIFLFSRNTKMMRNRNCFAEFRLFREIKKRRNFVSHCFAELKFSRFRKYFRKKDNFVHIFAKNWIFLFLLSIFYKVFIQCYIQSHHFKANFTAKIQDCVKKWIKWLVFNLIFRVIWMPGSGSVFWIWIRIQAGPEYGSNTDPDPQHWLLS